MITATLTDTPYQFVGHLNETDVELAYDDIRERWRLATQPDGSHGSYRILIDGIAYRFAGQVNRAAATLGRRGGRVKSAAKSAASRRNGAKGGRPRKAR